MKSSAIRAAIALALTCAVAVSLTGCSAPEPAFTAKTLTQVVNDVKAPSGYEVTIDQASSKAASDKYREFTNHYKADGVRPARCTDLGAVEGLTSAADFKGGVNDKVYDITRYTSDASNSDYEFFGVQGRIFSKAGAASQFLSIVRKISSKCVGGYTTQSMGTGSKSSPAPNVDSVVSTGIEALSRGVKGITLIEIAENSANGSSRSVAYVQRGNAVLAISTGIKPGSDSNFTPSSELSSSIAKQLSAVKEE